MVADLHLTDRLHTLNKRLQGKEPNRHQLLSPPDCCRSLEKTSDETNDETNNETNDAAADVCVCVWPPGGELNMVVIFTIIF